MDSLSLCFTSLLQDDKKRVQFVQTGGKGGGGTSPSVMNSLLSFHTAYNKSMQTKLQFDYRFLGEGRDLFTTCFYNSGKQAVLIPAYLSVNRDALL